MRPAHRHDGRERAAALSDAHPPRIQEHAREVTRVVDMEVPEEDGLQPCEVEACLDEGGRRPPAAVDDEDASVDDEGRGDSRPTGDRHGRPRRAEQHQSVVIGDPHALSSGCGRRVCRFVSQSPRILLPAGYCVGGFDEARAGERLAESVLTRSRSRTW